MTTTVKGERTKPTQASRVQAFGSATSYVGAILLKIATHQCVEAFVSSRVLKQKNDGSSLAKKFFVVINEKYLNESRLIAETVAAIRSHAVEMRLVLPVATVGILAVFVEPEAHVSFRDGFVF